MSLAITHSLFITTVVALVIFHVIQFFKATKSALMLSLGLLLYLSVLAMASLTALFNDFSSMPPNIIIAILPAFIFLMVAAKSESIKQFSQQLSLFQLTLIQSFRIVVELLLWSLAIHHIAPDLISWHGRNVDIIIGLSAPFLAYLTIKNKISKRDLLAWNVLGIVLVLNVFIHGLLSAPTPFQVFMTDPANTFVATFPYIWLPTFVVPSALFFHILSIRKLTS